MNKSTETASAIAASYGSDENGLVYGFLFPESGGGTPITAGQAIDWLARAENQPHVKGFVWLHFNLTNTASLAWMKQKLNLPLDFYDTLRGGSSGSTRIEFADDYLIGLLNDVLFDFSFDPSQVSTLIFSAGPRLIVTARSKSLRSIDRLRVAVRQGALFHSSTSLLVHLLRDQADVLTKILRDSIAKVDNIEDDLLSGKIDTKRANLGQLRRVLVRLKRLLAPEPAALFRLLARPPEWMDEDDVQELQQSTEEFSIGLNDIDTLQERIKLLQEEVSAQVQEENNRSLFVLTMFTVLALPVNMIAGLMGMNVGGVPLAQNGEGFWIVVTVVITITVVAGWWMFSKRPGGGGR